MEQASVLDRASAPLRRGRALARHVLRFASVLVGVGLLLRTGAADELSAVKPLHEDEQENSHLRRVTMPAPSFGSAAAAGASHARLADARLRAPAAVPGAAFASATRPVIARVATSVAPVAAASPAVPAMTATNAAPVVTATEAALLAAAPVIRAAPLLAQAPAARAQAVPLAARLAMPARIAPSSPVVAAVARPVRVAMTPRAVPAKPTDIARVMRQPASAWDYAGVSVPQVAAAAPTNAQPVQVAKAASAPVQLELPLAAPEVAPAAAPVQVQAAPVQAAEAATPAPARQDALETADSHGSEYLPENNVAARPVSRNALDQLAAMAARVKPINAGTSAYASAKANTASADVTQDRLPRPAF